MNNQDQPLNAAQIAAVQRTINEINKRILSDIDLRKHAISEALRAMESADGEWSKDQFIGVATAIHGFLTASTVDVGDTVADVRSAVAASESAANTARQPQGSNDNHPQNR